MNEGSDPSATVIGFEEVPAALFVFEGPQHRVVAANRLARALTGDRPNLIGLPLRQAVPELEGQQILEYLDRAFQTRQPLTQPERRVLLDRNGDGSLEEGFFAWSFTPAELDERQRGIIVHAIETTDLVRQRQVAEHRAAASERRYQEARDVVLTLQQHLLPTGVPVLPRARLSARYVVAAEDAAAGGDFFDAVPLTGGRVALLVGDVVGHGAAAAALMGQLRAVALQALTSGTDIAGTVARLDHLAGMLPGALGTTLCLAELDPATGVLRYVNRAHPAPLVLDLPGDARFLVCPPTTPLGMGDHAPVVHTDRLRPGQQLLLYSDGLVERAGRTLTDGLDDLVRVALAAANDPVGPDTTLPPVLLDRICELVIERMGTRGTATTSPCSPPNCSPRRGPPATRPGPPRAARWRGSAPPSGPGSPAWTWHRTTSPRSCTPCRRPARTPSNTRTRTAGTVRPCRSTASCTTTGRCWWRWPTTAAGDRRPPTRASAAGA